MGWSSLAKLLPGFLLFLMVYPLVKRAAWSKFFNSCLMRYHDNRGNPQFWNTDPWAKLLPCLTAYLALDSTKRRQWCGVTPWRFMYSVFLDRDTKWCCITILHLQLQKTLLEEAIVRRYRQTQRNIGSCLRRRKSHVSRRNSSVDVPSLQDGRFPWRCVNNYQQSSAVRLHKLHYTIHFFVKMQPIWNFYISWTLNQISTKLHFLPNSAWRIYFFLFCFFHFKG